MGAALMAFHVVESARITKGTMATRRGVGQYGAFMLPSPEPGWYLVCLADDGTDDTVPESVGWEHVSVHAFRGAKQRTPSWREMCFVKDAHWDPEDVVVQYHPRRSEYVNVHPHVLHLWRHATQPFPTPPPSLVGPAGGEPVVVP